MAAGNAIVAGSGGTGKTTTLTNVTASRHGQECSSNSDCKAEGCVCSAFAQPGSRLWTGTCELPYANVSDKQELKTSGFTSTVSSNSTEETELLEMVGPMACSCNCTYVSKSCCGSGSGVVHEAPAKKLGTLPAPSGQYCNRASGRFRIASASSDLDATS